MLQYPLALNFFTSQLNKSDTSVFILIIPIKNLKIKYLQFINSKHKKKHSNTQNSSKIKNKPIFDFKLSKTTK